VTTNQEAVIRQRRLQQPPSRMSHPDRVPNDVQRFGAVIQEKVDTLKWTKRQSYTVCLYCAPSTLASITVGPWVRNASRRAESSSPGDLTATAGAPK
jgi:hypothetical protein